MSDSRFVGGKDPVRNPKVQRFIENQFKDNYKKVLLVMRVDITRVLTKKKGNDIQSRTDR